MFFFFCQHYVDEYIFSIFFTNLHSIFLDWIWIEFNNVNSIVELHWNSMQISFNVFEFNSIKSNTIIIAHDVIQYFQKL
jgi:hypothetical protein